MLLLLLLIKSTFCQCELTTKNKIIIVKGVVTFKWVAEVIVGIRRIKERNLLKLWQNNKNKIVLLIIGKFGRKYI